MLYVTNSPVIHFNIKKGLRGYWKDYHLSTDLQK